MIFNESYLSENNTIGVGEYSLAKLKSDPNNIRIAKTNNNYYIYGKDLLEYMQLNNMSNFKYALKTISECNDIRLSKTVVVTEGIIDEEIIDLMVEDGILVEKSVESDMMTVNQAKKWYKKFITKTKSTSEDSSKDLDEKIALLKKCKNNMEKEVKAAEKRSTSGKFKYMLKNAIPFNSIARLIRYKDIYAGLGLLVPSILSVSIRHVAYTSMLKNCITYTDEAIEYLEQKRKEF